MQHHVEVSALGPWLEAQLGFDASCGIETRDWLTVSQQRLLEVTTGAVFHDGLGELDAVRRSLAWYPRDVWLWLLACGWRRIAQEEAFVGRTREADDELGSRIADRYRTPRARRDAVGVPDRAAVRPLSEVASERPRVEAVRTLDPDDSPTTALAVAFAPCVLTWVNWRAVTRAQWVPVSSLASSSLTNDQTLCARERSHQGRKRPAPRYF